MIPVTGVDAGAGKAGLIQSSATSPGALECRKVLFGQKVTTIPVPVFTLFPESETAWEFAGGALDSTVTARSRWTSWGSCEAMEFAPASVDFLH
jgi:hypothetical protein